MKSRSARAGSRCRSLFPLLVAATLAGCSSSGVASPNRTTTTTTPVLVGQVFSVRSGSMVPTIEVGDSVVVRQSSIHRGDIIVFRRPPADVGTTDADLIKRVVGLPGETISSRGNTVLINGKPLREPWLPTLKGLCAEDAENIPTTKIAPDHYFVMGDCRGDSADSRVWGTLAGSLIVGRVVGVIKP